MPTMDEMLYKVKEEGAPAATASLAQTERQFNRTAQAAQKSATAHNATRQSFSNLTFQAMGLAYGLQQIAVGFTAASGIGNAARFQQLEVGFTTLLGSADKARKMLGDLRQMGARTPFNTMELTGYARQLLAVGFAADSIIPTMGTLTDTISAMGLGTEEVGRLTRVIGQIRSKGKGLTGNDPIQLAELGINLGAVVGAAQGRNMTRAQAESYLAGQSGEKVAEILLRGLQTKFGGSAQAQGNTLLGVAQNLGETAGNIMLPTGRILVGALTPVAQVSLRIAEGFQAVNEASGGAVGLIALTYGLYRAKMFVIGAYRLTITTIRELTGAIMALGGAARGTAAAVGGTAASSAAASWAAGGTAVAAGGAGLGARALGLIKGIGAGPMAFLASLAVGAVGGAIGGTTGGVLSGAGAGAGIGSLGFLFGPVVGGITTALGAIVGGIKGYFDAQNAGDAAQRTATATEKMAQSLERIKIELIGGGPRSRYGASLAENEIALAKMRGGAFA